MHSETAFDGLEGWSGQCDIGAAAGGCAAADAGAAMPNGMSSTASRSRIFAIIRDTGET